MGIIKILTGAIFLFVFSGVAVAGDFSINNDGNVADNDTQLIWQESDDGLPRNWEEALAYCENLTLSDDTDWRIPNIKELESISDDFLSNPTIDLVFFSATNTLANFWSSTTNAGSTAGAWVVNIQFGNIIGVGKTSDAYVRCVRSAD